MATPASEQRNTRRFQLKLPVAVNSTNGGEIDAQTKDVSARGVFFYVDSAMEEGSQIEFTLTLPPDITLTEAIKVHCVGKVVRVDKKDGSEIGIAAAIEQYDFVGE